MMQVPFVDLSVQYASIKEELTDASNEVFSDSRFVGGDKVREFEQSLEKYLDTGHCVSCANGTDAIEIALHVLGVGKGDEVIVPAMSWISTASAVHTVGARPVFVDILSDVYTIDPELIKDKITARTKAIIPVHLYGQMARVEEVRKIADENDLFVIEDAAQAVGATRNKKNPGVHSDLSTYSFYPSKNLGGFGDGGAICTNESVYSSSAKILCNMGQKESQNHVALGRNSKLDSLQAAWLSVKLKYLDGWNKKRGVIAKAYEKLLSDLPIRLPEVDKGNVSNFHLYVIQVPNRNLILEKMKKQGVSCQLHYPKALPFIQPLKTFASGEFPVAKQLGESCLSLPMYPEMTEDQVKYVAEQLRKAI